MIKGFFDEYRWLSNFYPVEIKYEDIIYPSIEHFYVAMKVNEDQAVDVNGSLINFKLNELRKYISSIEHPGQVKKIGKKLEIRKDWDDIKISIMKYALKEKFSKEPFRTKLINTNNRYIEESNNWKDTYWGVDIASGEGKNVLGKLIMKIRNDIK